MVLDSRSTTGDDDFVDALKLPEGPYTVIYADPPWPVQYLRGGKTAGSIGGYQPLPYESAELDAITSLPITKIVAKDALVFLWCLDKFLPDVRYMMRAWGFSYKDVAFVWNKVSLHHPNKVRCTLGPTTRKSCELCLMGVRGLWSRLIVDHKVQQYIGVPSTYPRVHSKKPAVVRDRIVQLCGNVPRIELFARQRVEGWDAWGNELPPLDSNQAGGV